LIGASRISPFKFSRENEFLPSIAAILKGPNQRWSNFPCFPVPSFLVGKIIERGGGGE
jgi:hypothetical protein